MTLPQTRTRLTPEARRDQLLDTAKRMIVDDGLQAFTTGIEQI
jgi:DNA-binding transcriptional regulator YbjK